MSDFEACAPHPDNLAAAPSERGETAHGFEQSPLPQLMMEGPLHVLRAVNAAARAVVGDQLRVGLPLQQAFAGELTHRAADRFDAVFASGQTFFLRGDPTAAAGSFGSGSGCAVLNRQDIYLTRWQCPDAGPGGVLVTCVNVSNLHDAFAQNSSEQDNDAARVAFTDGIAHDLRGPLTAVRLALESICGAHPRGQKNKCCRALRALQRADDLIENLLDVSSVHAGKAMVIRCTDVDLVPTLREIVRDCRDTFSTPIHFHHDARLLGYFDARLVGRALQNLVHNAMVHGTYGQPIEVRLAARKSGKEMFLQVINLGPTIPIEEQARILARFGRGEVALQQGAPGWGLGLAVVQAVAGAHGGELALHSAGGRTTFTVTLPTRRATHPVAPSAGASPPDVLHPGSAAFQ